MCRTSLTDIRILQLLCLSVCLSLSLTRSLCVGFCFGISFLKMLVTWRKSPNLNNHYSTWIVFVYIYIYIYIYTLPTKLLYTLLILDFLHQNEWYIFFKKILNKALSTSEWICNSFCAKKNQRNLGISWGTARELCICDNNALDSKLCVNPVSIWLMPSW